MYRLFGLEVKSAADGSIVDTFLNNVASIRVQRDFFVKWLKHTNASITCWTQLTKKCGTS